MALLLGTIEWVQECDHHGCQDHQRRAQFQQCYAGDRTAATLSVGAGFDYEGGHAVEVPLHVGDDWLLAVGWEKRGRTWHCPECISAEQRAKNNALQMRS